MAYNVLEHPGRFWHAVNTYHIEAGLGTRPNDRMPEKRDYALAMLSKNKKNLGATYMEWTLIDGRRVNKTHSRCICSQNHADYLYFFENIHTGHVVCLGSTCASIVDQSFVDNVSEPVKPLNDQLRNEIRALASGYRC
jgi:hypothetical protein